MGRRGPAPTPVPILKLRGTLRSDRVRNPPEGPSGTPTCPDWIDAEAKAAWKHVVPLLERMGVLTRIDRNALTRYCQQLARWKKAEQFIQQHGEVYTIKDEANKVKTVQQFPQVAIAHKLAANLTRLEAEFGMTPSSRSRISMPNQTPGGFDAKSRFFDDAG